MVVKSDILIQTVHVYQLKAFQQLSRNKSFANLLVCFLPTFHEATKTMRVEEYIDCAKRLENEISRIFLKILRKNRFNFGCCWHGAFRVELQLDIYWNQFWVLFQLFITFSILYYPRTKILNLPALSSEIRLSSVNS